MSLTFYRLKLDVFWSANTEKQGRMNTKAIGTSETSIINDHASQHITTQTSWILNTNAPENSNLPSRRISKNVIFCQHVSVWTAVVTELQERPKVRNYLNLPSEIKVASDSSKLRTYTRFQKGASTTWLYICCSLLTSIWLCHTTHGMALFLHFYTSLFIFKISRSKLESLYFTAARTRQWVRLLYIHLER